MRKAVEEMLVDGEETLRHRKSMSTRVPNTEGKAINTYIGAVIESVINGGVEELSKVSDSQSAIPRTRWWGAFLNLLEDRLGIRLRNEGGAMAVIPSPFLVFVRSQNTIRRRYNVPAHRREPGAIVHELSAESQTAGGWTNLVSLLYIGKPLGGCLDIPRVLIRMVDQSQPTERPLETIDQERGRRRR